MSVVDADELLPQTEHRQTTNTNTESSHHFLDDLPQGASLYILCDEVESLVLIEDANELEHVGVIQATHDLHLMKQRHTFLHTPECCSRISFAHRIRKVNQG